MINKEWEEFFEIEDGYDILDTADSFTGIKKDAVAALASCINTNGCVDMNWIQEASALSVDELQDALEGAIFQDPEVYDRDPSEYTGWILRAQYLSGNIKNRLNAAQRLNRKYHGRFERNIRALNAVMPERVDFEEIGFGIGSPWIPEKVYELFAKEVLGLSCRPEIRHSAAFGQWKVSATPDAKNTVHNRYTYGTERISALQIMECTLNGGTVKIYDEVSRPDRKTGTARILNKNETLAAQEKQELLQTAFQEWVRKDPSRVKLLEDIFNDIYASSAAGRYNGGFLALPGLNTDHFVPYPHQKDAVARMILEKDVLLNHRVGSGKTNIIIMGIHERKRIGLSEKNLVVVPNQVLEAFERAHRELYPQDKLLIVHPEDFKPACRQSVLMKIRDEDYTAVYMAFSSFERIGMSRQYKLDKQEELIRTCRAQAAGSSEKWEKQRLETMAERLCKALEEMKWDLPTDEYITFDELGITTLAVDEAHNFKNISLSTRSDGVVGLHAKGSKRCDELLEKVRFVREHGGGVVFSTGTPLTNSISDLFALQTFLQPEQLKLLHLDHFDEWISNFATRQTGFEVDIDSQSYRIRTRFSSFHNIPELAGLFANVCDFYNGDDGDAELPECEGYTDVVVPKSPEQREYIENLVIRTEMIRQKLVRSAEDNLLKVTHDGRAAAQDIRLVDPTAKPDPEGTKIYACAQKIYSLWKEYPKTAQLVFCDMGTPKKGFNVYDELKYRLEHMGVPASEIAYVHDAATDAQKRSLFLAVNNASVRILIGSRSKLGTGVNVQERLIGIHHLDIPWRPSDMVQGDGRMIRQGNINKTVYRFRYVTAGTFDAYSWQLLENKQRFISQFMSSHLTGRDVRDIDDTVLTYAEIKALSVGDPLLKTRIDTANELERLKIHARQRDQELRKFENVVKETPEVLNRLENRKKCLEMDKEYFAAKREGLSKAERKAFGEEVLEALAQNGWAERERLFDVLHGFRILLPAHMRPERPNLQIEGVSGMRYNVDMRGAKPGGCIQRIEHVLTHLDDRIHSAEEETVRAKAQEKQAKAELEKGNRYTKEAAELTGKLLNIDEELNRRASETETPRR